MQRTIPIILALVLAACGGGEVGSGTEDDETTTAPPTTAPPIRLMQADLIGGCFMMGPNCARYVIYSDSSVEVHRLGSESPELLWVATIDEALAADLSEALAATDLEVLRSGLGPGTCHACVDGIDTVLTFFQGGAETMFDSAQVELDTAEPLFAAADAAVRAAAATGQVPIITR